MGVVQRAISSLIGPTVQAAVDVAMVDVFNRLEGLEGRPVFSPEAVTGMGDRVTAVEQRLVLSPEMVATIEQAASMVAEFELLAAQAPDASVTVPEIK